MTDTDTPSDNPFRAPKPDGRATAVVPKSLPIPLRRFCLMYGMWGLYGLAAFLADRFLLEFAKENDAIPLLLFGLVFFLGILSIALTANVVAISVHRRHWIVVVASIPAIIASIIMALGLLVLALSIARK